MMPVTKRTGGYVYFITDGEYVKIGCTKDPQKRLASIQTGNARICRILLLIPTEKEEDAYQLEHILHQYCAPCRKSGEWFALGAKTAGYRGFSNSSASASTVKTAKEWIIKTVNENGTQMPIKTVNKLAAEIGISGTTLARAKAELAKQNMTQTFKKGYGKDSCYYIKIWKEDSSDDL